MSARAVPGAVAGPAGVAAVTPDGQRAALYAAMYRIRRFEETVLANFASGLFAGTTHTYLGQEADAAGVLSHIRPGDVVVSNHRCHGHFLAYGGEMRALFAELMGRSTGVCGGRGGSQHLHWRDFYSNGILGGTAPMAVGMALAERISGGGNVAVVFLGDGALGEGAVYEALNLASLWRAPILFVVEDNGIAQTTPGHLAIAGSLRARMEAFAIPVTELDSSDVVAVSAVAGELLAEVRSAGRPRGLLVHTARLGPHSKGDDTRPASELERLRTERDPISIHRGRLDAAGREAVEAAAEAEVTDAYRAAVADPPAVGLRVGSVEEPRVARRPPVGGSASTVLAELNAGLHAAFSADERVHVLGEDILDPYGGAFKVTQGLSTTWPDRVHTSPVSEAGIAGVAAGMALRGLRPVVEVMFGDFCTLIVDQVVNHIAKLRSMYDGGVTVPLVIRTPMGGRRGYGATHSQTLEKLFLGVPGLRVVAPCALRTGAGGGPGDLLARAILDDDEPVLFVENKLLYSLPVRDSRSLTDLLIHASEDAYPTYTVVVAGAPTPSATIAAYGYMAELAREALVRLAFEHEVFAELVVPTQLAPLIPGDVLRSAAATGRLVTAEEGTLSLGWGAEVVARAAEALGPRIEAVRRVAAAETSIPAAPGLEAQVLPGVEEIVSAVLAVV